MSRLLSVLTLLALTATSPCAGEKALQKDFTAATLESIGVQPVASQKDPKTGFVVGGKNATVLIRKLTALAGQPIAKLEKRMRPGADSSGGCYRKPAWPCRDTGCSL